MDLSNYIEHKNFPEFTNALERSQEFYDLMKERRSVRHFQETEVDENLIKNAVKTAGTAPSGANKQPWFFSIIKDPRIKKAIRIKAEQEEETFYEHRAPQSWLNDLRPFGTDSEKPFLETAPYLVVVFSANYFQEEEEKKKNYYALESTGMAVGMLLASLHNSGLGTLTHTPNPMKFLNDILGVPSFFKPFVIVVVGRPVSPLMVPNIKRKDFDEISSMH